MRAMPDDQLPEPYRSWIDRTRPLPDDVRLFPRTIRLVHDVAYSALSVVALIGVGSLLCVGWSYTSDARGPVLVVGGACLLVLLWIAAFSLRRMVNTIGAHRDAERGMLRQGILISPEGLLVRLTPNRCYSIPLDRFVNAKIVHWANDGPSSRSKLVIETLDGQVELPFFEGRLADPPETINRHVGWLRKEVKRSSVPNGAGGRDGEQDE